MEHDDVQRHDSSPQSERHVIAVLRSRDEAERAARQLERLGVDRRLIRIDDPADVTTSLRAEQRQELDDSVIMPQASFIATKEGTRGFVAIGVVTLIVSLLVAFPVALIDFGLSYWWRYLIVFAIIMTMGFTLALVFGPSLGTKDKDDVAAATRGSLLYVGANSPSIREALSGCDAIRVDEVSPAGDPKSTVYTESDPIDHSVTEQVKDTTNQVRHQYHRPR